MSKHCVLFEIWNCQELYLHFIIQNYIDLLLQWRSVYVFRHDEAACFSDSSFAIPLPPPPAHSPAASWLTETDPDFARPDLGDDLEALFSSPDTRADHLGDLIGKFYTFNNLYYLFIELNLSLNWDNVKQNLNPFDSAHFIRLEFK